MTGEMRARARAYVAELPGALLLSILTATTTIVLALIISLVLGGESRALQEQAVANGQETVDHAAVSRCELAHVVDILKEIGEQAEGLDLSKYEELNTDGLDCDAILLEPFTPGRNIIPFATPGPTP